MGERRPSSPSLRRRSGSWPENVAAQDGLLRAAREGEPPRVRKGEGRGCPSTPALGTSLVVVLDPPCDLAVGEDVRHVGVDRPFSHVESPGYLPVARAFGDGLEHLALPGGQPFAG